MAKEQICGETNTMKPKLNVVGFLRSFKNVKRNGLIAILKFMDMQQLILAKYQYGELNGKNRGRRGNRGDVMTRKRILGAGLIVWPFIAGRIYYGDWDGLLVGVLCGLIVLSIGYGVWLIMD